MRNCVKPTIGSCDRSTTGSVPITGLPPMSTIAIRSAFEWKRSMSTAHRIDEELRRPFRLKTLFLMEDRRAELVWVGPLDVCIKLTNDVHVADNIT